ncbi:MAG: hypothetical protein J0H64_03565 [Actinobacteria bacterium]|nr:hypothetical protein [Actinomycetota bacterium]
MVSGAGRTGLRAQDAVPTSGPRGALNPVVRRIGGLVLAASALLLGVLAAWPIYQTARLWLVAAVALLLAAAAVWVRDRWRLSVPVFAALLLIVFAITVVPVAVPDALSGGAGGLLGGLRDGLAATALGWKQLLTLTLPVQSYRTVLVPFYLVSLGAALAILLFSRSSGRLGVLGALPALLPVAFGTVFGPAAGQLSPSILIGPFSIVAPRETSLWVAAILLAASWVIWISGAPRRAALRLGRMAGEGAPRRSGGIRGLVGAGLLIVAVLGGLVLAPILDTGARAVPRDGVTPAQVIAEQASPLSAFRAYKRDGAFAAPLFSVDVTSDATSGGPGKLPDRLRLAVLDHYDGVDYSVGGEAVTRFRRFPSGAQLQQPSRIEVRIESGYAGQIWVPTTALLGEPPTFGGVHAAALADAFYVNDAAGSAIAIPPAGSGATDATAGLREGDTMLAEMETAPSRGELGAPLAGSGSDTTDADQTMPKMSEWIAAQGDAGGDLATLISRLRARGYLSHSRSAEGASEWSAALGIAVKPSLGGHSRSRIEALFGQLNELQSRLPGVVDDRRLVAGVGDDEQFAAAAALVAQRLGYESRVVLGVRLAEPATAAQDASVPNAAAQADTDLPMCAGGAGPGERLCAGKDLSAWIEVKGSAGRWVPFDVTPQHATPPVAPPTGNEPPQHETVPEESDAHEVEPPPGLEDQKDVQNKQDDDAEAASWVWPVLRAVGLSAAAGALILIPILFLPLAKRRRSGRRRSETVPELRALGAWDEMLDRARDAGVAIPADRTRGEVARMLGTVPAVWAAEQVDRAVFAPRTIGEGDADMLWAAVDADSSERAAGLTRRARWLARYSLRSYGVGRGRFGGSRRPRPGSGDSPVAGAGAGALQRTGGAR